MSTILFILIICLNFYGYYFKCSQDYHDCGENSAMQCVHKSWVCDYNQDCDDNSDEVNCPPMICEKNQFKCPNSDLCIPREKLCDGINDCIDNEDELNCTILNKCNEKIHYDCKNREKLECIAIEDICNTKINCSTKRDSLENCQVDICKTSYNNCSHICINKYSSFTCDCPPDMELSKDNRNCKHLNKCLENPELCHQGCQDNGKFHKCFCYDGYTKHDHKCVPITAEKEIYLLYSSFNSIYSVSIFDLNPLHYKTNEIFRGQDGILSLDVKFDVNEMVIYSSLVEKDNVVQVAKLQNWPLNMDKYLLSNSKKLNMEMNLENLSVFSTVVDPARNLLFFTDYNHSSIFVMNLTSFDKMKIVDEDCYFPFNIIIDPVMGRLFWIDLGNGTVGPKIKMANMDGSFQYTLLEKDIRKPTSLAIDIEEQRLYWADQFPSAIKYIDINSISQLNIETFSVLAIEYFHPFSIFIFGNRIYWSDVKEHKIYSAHKITGKDVKVIDKRVKPINLRIISQESNRQLIKKINEHKIGMYCSGVINTCHGSCLPNHNIPEMPKCFGTPSKVIEIKNNHLSLWLILIPVVILGFVCIVLFKYRFSRTRIIKQPEINRVFVYDSVQFYEDQNGLQNDNATVSDTVPIINNGE